MKQPKKPETFDPRDYAALEKMHTLLYQDGKEAVQVYVHTNRPTVMHLRFTLHQLRASLNHWCPKNRYTQMANKLKFTIYHIPKDVTKKKEEAYELRCEKRDMEGLHSQFHSDEYLSKVEVPTAEEVPQELDMVPEPGDETWLEDVFHAMEKP